jgi:hypothetical protein
VEKTICSKLAVLDISRIDMNICVSKDPIYVFLCDYKMYLFLLDINNP